MWLPQGSDPFFSNDPIGFIKVVGAFIIGMSPILLLTVWFLRRGPDVRIAKTESDLTQLGQKVDRMGIEAAQDRVAVNALHREMAENQRALVEMLTVNSLSIRADVQKVALDIARLQERSDIAECFDRLSKTLEHVLTPKRGD